MGRYPDPIGNGGLWVKESKKGRKFFSMEMTFTYNGHPVTVKAVGFENNKQNERQPDYALLVNDAFPAKPKEDPLPSKPDGLGPDTDDSDIPF